MSRNEFARLVVFAIGGLLLVGSVSTGVAAQSADDETRSGDAIDVGSHDLVVRDLSVTIADTHLAGPGLPERSVDEAAYAVDDATISTDEFTVTINGREVQVGQITVAVDNVGVTLENVSIGPSAAG